VRIFATRYAYTQGHRKKKKNEDKQQKTPKQDPGQKTLK